MPISLEPEYVLNGELKQAFYNSIDFFIIIFICLQDQGIIKGYWLYKQRCLEETTIHRK